MSIALKTRISPTAEAQLTKEFIGMATFMDKEPWPTSVIPACPESFFSAGLQMLFARKIPDKPE
jgi:hypothetical protein